MAWAQLAFVALLGTVAPASALTGQVKLAWDAVDPNVTDLAGYRVYWSTDSNNFNLTPAQARAAGVSFTDVGSGTTTATILNISTTTTTFFGVTAFDLSANESGFSNLVSSTGFVTPTVRSVSPTSAEEGTTGLDVTISGDNFASGSTVDFADPNGILINSLDTSGAPSSIRVNIDIAPLARVAGRTVTVTNPGGGAGSKPLAFTVKVDVARVDIDGSSRIDNADFVQLLLGYPSAAGDSRYNTMIDLDADGLVNGADLAIFFTYFGMVAPFP